MGLALLSSPPAPKMPAPASAESALAEALLHWRGGNLIQAEALCAQVRARHPDHVHALMLAAAMRSSAGDLDAAEALLSRTVTLAPGRPMASHFMAQLQQRRGDDAKAVALFEAAAKAQPNYAPTQNDLGVSLQRLGRHSASVAAFDRAIALDPGFATAHCNRGLVLLAMGRASDAAQSLRAVLGLTPNSAATWYTLGLAHQSMSEFDQAETAFRRALELDPGCDDARLNLAHALYRGHRRKEATSDFAEWSRRQGIKVKPCLGEPPIARMLLIGGTGPHNTPTHFLFAPRHFETVTLYLPPEEMPEGDLALLDACPEFDMVFNAVGDPDCGASYLRRIEALSQHIDVPILNPPERVAQTRRDDVAAALGDIAEIIVPCNPARAACGARRAGGDRRSGRCAVDLARRGAWRRRICGGSTILPPSRPILQKCPSRNSTSPSSATIAAPTAISANTG